MKKSSITDAKNNLSALIDGLKSGSPVLIVDRGRPVARLEPVAPSADDQAGDDGRLNGLERDGVLRRGGGAVPKSILTRQPPRPKAGASALRALLDERRSGR
ncbi:MAG TPA: type II toxin-antitoxin system prevent-host-death family antitoxin [Vicinamibacterales bacterium]|nr:type II toxin-antitoxin system prevent-host-death family antitoxin [Vicinamibacterales bacterium]